MSLWQPFIFDHSSLPLQPSFISASLFLFSENPDVTTKSFGFCTKNSIPLYYVSASDGTNVVKTFTDAIEKAVEYKKNPLDIDDQIMEELENFDNK